ncbi:RNA polymerase III-inhibiting protein maf1, partial [Nowakowskiella sp. JEL0078]
MSPPIESLRLTSLASSPVSPFAKSLEFQNGSSHNSRYGLTVTNQNLNQPPLPSPYSDSYFGGQNIPGDQDRYSPESYSVGSFSIAKSPFGSLSEPSSTSRKMLFYLLATLNAAFPDYDFSDAQPEFFCKIPSISIVMNTVNTTLFNLGNEKFSQIAGSTIWDAIDEVMVSENNDVIIKGSGSARDHRNVNEDLEIYQFLPDDSSEPGGQDGTLWSFYYFFFSRKLKRVLFFTIRAVSFIAPLQPEENMDLMQDMRDDDIDLSMEYENRNERNEVSYEEYTMFEQE